GLTGGGGGNSSAAGSAFGSTDAALSGAFGTGGVVSSAAGVGVTDSGASGCGAAVSASGAGDASVTGSGASVEASFSPVVSDESAGAASATFLIRVSSNSSVILSLTSTPPESSLVFQVTTQSLRSRRREPSRPARSSP